MTHSTYPSSFLSAQKQGHITIRSAVIDLAPLRRNAIGPGDLAAILIRRLDKQWVTLECFSKDRGQIVENPGFFVGEGVGVVQLWRAVEQSAFVSGDLQRDAAGCIVKAERLAVTLAWVDGLLVPHGAADRPEVDRVIALVLHDSVADCGGKRDDGRQGREGDV